MKTSPIYSASYFSLGGFGVCVGAKPPKVPRGDGPGRSYGHLRGSFGSLPRY